jgi:cytosine/adenosine deaminase-related metal-dependent hydrolase
MDRETYVDFTSPILKWEALAVHRRRMTSIFRPAPANVEELLASDSTKWAVRKDGPLHMHLQQSRDEHDIRFRDRISHYPNTNDEVGCCVGVFHLTFDPR